MTPDASLLQANPQVPDEDVRLLHAFRTTGDREALNRLLIAHAPTAYRVALRLAGNAAEADDVVQDAFVRCMVHANSYRGTGTVRSWIIAVVANTFRQRRTAEQRRQRRERAVAAPADVGRPGPEDLHELLMTVLATLPDRYRQPVMMRYIDNLDFADIAAALETKEKSVRTWVSRGIERLREGLIRRGVTLGAAALVTTLAPARASAAPTDFTALVQAAMTKGATATVASVGTMATPALVGVKAAVAAGVLAIALAAGGWWTLRSEPVSDAVAAPQSEPVSDAVAPEPVIAEGHVLAALDQPVTIHSDGSLEETLHLLQRAQAKSPRIALTAPDSLFTGLKRGTQGIITAQPAAPLLGPISLHADGLPLRAVLDALCAAHGLRWTQTSAGVVIDRPLAEAERLALITAFMTADDAAGMAVTARALIESTDAACLRPLLLALAQPGERCAAAVLQLERSTQYLAGSIPDTVMAEAIADWPSPLIAWCDDPEVAAATLAAVARKQEPQGALLGIAGQLCLSAVVDQCVGLVRTGLREPTVMERIQSKLGGGNTNIVLARAAATALGWIGDPRGVQPLVDAISAATYPHEPRDAAIAALGRLRDARAVTPLLAIATDKRRWAPLRGQAIAALGKLGDNRATEAIGMILLDVSDDSHWVRLQAPHALANIRSPRALELLCAGAIMPDNEHFTSSRAIDELGYLGGPAAERALLQILPRYFAGEAASRAIGRIRNPTMVPMLEKMLAAAEEDSYRHIVDALAKMRHPLADRVLLATIPAADDPHLHQHARALGNTPETLAALMAMVQPGHPVRQRSVAAAALASRGGTATLRAIDLASNDPDRSVRISAIAGCGLAIRRGEVPGPILTAWMSDADDRIRIAAVEVALMYVLDEQLVTQAFEQATTDRSPRVRRMALSRHQVFGGTPARIEAIFARMGSILASDSDAEVRFAAARAAFPWPLPTVPERAYIGLADALLLAARSDAEPRVRAMAGQTLARLAHATQVTPHRPVLLQRQLQELRAILDREADKRVVPIVRRAIDQPKEYLQAEFPWPEPVPVDVPVDAPVDAPTPGADDF